MAQALHLPRNRLQLHVRGTGNAAGTAHRRRRAQGAADTNKHGKVIATVELRTWSGQGQDRVHLSKAVQRRVLVRTGGSAASSTVLSSHAAQWSVRTAYINAFSGPSSGFSDPGDSELPEVMSVVQQCLNRILGSSWNRSCNPQCNPGVPADPSQQHHDLILIASYGDALHLPAILAAVRPHPETTSKGIQAAVTRST